jgi:hypothetical protein
MKNPALIPRVMYGRGICCGSQRPQSHVHSGALRALKIKYIRDSHLTKNPMACIARFAP